MIALGIWLYGLAMLMIFAVLSALDSVSAGAAGGPVALLLLIGGGILEARRVRHR